MYILKLVHWNYHMHISSVFDNLPISCLICALSVIIYIHDITKWGELSFESGASCLRRDFHGVSCPVSK